MKEIEFYKKLAEEIKPLGYKCFLYNEDNFAWLYVITPNNSWLYIDEAMYTGYNIVYQYKPESKLGSGCCCFEEPIYEINERILKIAEDCGKNYYYTGWEMVPNRYDGRSHREIVRIKPIHYKDAMEALKKHWCYNKLVEL